jgi:excisionase family DNA binding protein
MARRTRRHPRRSPPSDVASIAKAYRSALRHRGRITVHAAGTRTTIPLPTQVAAMLGRVLTAIADGRSVRITAHGEEVTTVDAAQMLGVSRPFIIAQIDAGRLPCRMVGSHRRIRTSDLEMFQRSMERSEHAMQELADQAQDLGLGY